MYSRYTIYFKDKRFHSRSRTKQLRDPVQTHVSPTHDDPNLQRTRPPLERAHDPRAEVSIVHERSEGHRGARLDEQLEALDGGAHRLPDLVLVRPVYALYVARVGAADYAPVVCADGRA